MFSLDDRELGVFVRSCFANRAMPIPAPAYFALVFKTSERN